MTARAASLFKNRNFVFMLAMVLALTVGLDTRWTEPLLMPALGITMTLSVLDITNRDLTSMRRAPRPVLLSFLFNYVAMGGGMLLMARWLIKDAQIWGGFVTLAAMPPAVSAVPFSYMLGGNTVFSLLGTAGLYIASLGITPALMILFLGSDFVNPLRLLIILAQLIVLPLVVSRLLIYRGLVKRIKRWRDTVVTWSYFLVIYVIIGVNREVFFSHHDILFEVVVIALAVTFGLAHIIDFSARRMNVDRSTVISWVVVGTRKNAGLASAIAITFLGEKAAFPAGVITLCGISQFLWLGFYYRKICKREGVP
ncbi:MAG: hypothetical protein R6T78_03170 [Dehalococcoidales bacterium]